MTASAQEQRTLTIHEMLVAAEGRRDVERVKLAWRDGHVMATVIEVPLSSVVLNPRSHRIRAQLESSAKAHIVQRDPFGLEAQAVIASLLRETERFDQLREDLKELGQLDPGVVTHGGLLVNANTRCVALRDLNDPKRRHIRVAVLPQDASEEDVDQLELRLQMKRDFRREYSFSNELLFIDELIQKHKYSHRAIAIEMGWATASNRASLKKGEDQVQQSVRMLTILREVQALSDDKLPITRFDDDRQSIKELDEDYERLTKNDPAGAAILRDTRLVALLSEVGYREMRLIDEHFLEDYLVDALEEQSAFKGRVEGLLAPPAPIEASVLPGLDILRPDVVASAGETVKRSAAPLLTLLAETAQDEKVTLQDPNQGAVSVVRELFIGELKAAIDVAAGDAKLDRDKGDLLDKPKAFVKRALKHLATASEAFEEAKASERFDREGLKSALEEVGRAHQAFLAKLEA